MDICLDLAQEAAQLSDCYSHVHELTLHASVRDYIPYSWSSLVQVKREYYAGMSHYHAAAGILHKEADNMSSATKDVLQFLHVESAATQLDIRMPKDETERRLLG